jgi:hypothetical protein
MSDRSWFFASEGQQQGPYPQAQLREFVANGTVTAETLVWTEGMTGWQKAGEIPGLLSGEPGPPAVPGSGGPLMTVGGHDGGRLSIELGIWELFWRTFVLWIGVALVIPVPWVATMYCRWIVSRVRAPQRSNLTITGRAVDLMWFYAVLILFIAAELTDSQLLNVASGIVQVLLYWLVIKWFIANISADGLPLGLRFSGSFWAYFGWTLLAAVSVITIIGWAWVITAQTRWMCRHVEGTRRAIVFTPTGWEMLARTLLFALGCMLLIPIPWVLGWYTRWYVSQFALVERTAYATA